jgi:hydroxymethylpyrimidine pyrophosphatase-like HAD family hydrolase
MNELLEQELPQVAEEKVFQHREGKLFLVKELDTDSAVVEYDGSVILLFFDNNIQVDIEINRKDLEQWIFDQKEHKNFYWHELVERGDDGLPEFSRELTWKGEDDIVDLARDYALNNTSEWNLSEA